MDERAGTRPCRPPRGRRLGAGTGRSASTAPSRMWSSIQPDARRLQQRVIQEEQEPPARPQHPADLIDGAVGVIDVLEHQARDDGVEDAVVEGERAGARAGVADTAARAGRRRAARPRGSTPTRADSARRGRSDPRRSRRRAPRAQPASVLDCQRDDLLLVLGVGAVGEVRPATTRRSASQCVSHRDHGSSS